MPAIGVHDQTFDKLRLLARAWNINEGEVVARLLNEFQRTDRRHSEAAGGREGLALHVTYEGTRVTATYDPVTSGVTITSGGLAGQTFRSPSGAAAALVGHLNPAVKPNRSGWSFWTLTDSAELLQSIRPR